MPTEAATGGTGMIRYADRSYPNAPLTRVTSLAEISFLTEREEPLLVRDREAVKMTLFRTLVLLLYISLIFASCRPEGAHESSDASKEGPEQGIRLAEFRSGQLSNFQRFDVDHDNIVEYSDLPKKASKRFRRMDRNRDSQVTLSEFEEAAVRRFEGADKNHDGRLDASETN